MKLPKIILAVIALHLVVPAALLVQPGCQSRKPVKAQTEPEILGTPTVASSSQSNQQGLDSAFNAGFTERKPVASAGVNTVSSGRYEPTRPAWDDINSVNDFSTSSSNNQISAPVSTVKPESVLEPVVQQTAESVQTAGAYTVRKGDSLWGIANRHGVTLRDLLNVNSMSKNAVIHPGDTLDIPIGGRQASTPAPRTSTPVSTPVRIDSGDSLTYIVIVGDTLSTIARRYGTDVKTLMSVNNISDPSRLRAGQELMIPGAGTEVVRIGAKKKPAVTRSDASLSGTALTYRVRRGDTLGSISRQFDVGVKELMTLNGISDPRALRAGQEILIRKEGGNPRSTRPMLTRDPQAQDIIPEVETETSSGSLDVFDNYDDIPVVPVEN